MVSTKSKNDRTKTRNKESRNEKFSSYLFAYFTGNSRSEEAIRFAISNDGYIRVPGKDEWYILYHRFNYPKGILMGNAAWYNREVCIDKLEFNKDGGIIQVRPTHEGVKAISVQKK